MKKQPTRTWQPLFTHLDRKALTRLANEIVTHGRQAEGWARDRFLDVIKPLRIKGFSSALGAPPALQARALADALPKHWPVAWLGLSVWMDSQRSLWEQVRKALAASRHPLYPADALPQMPAEGLPEGDLRALEEMAGASDEKLTRSDLRLMIFCVTGVLPGDGPREGESHTGEAEDAPDESDTWDAADVSYELKPADAITMLDSWVRDGSLNEEDWRALTRAIAEWQVSGESWRQRRSEEGAVDAAVGALRERHAKALDELFGDFTPELTSGGLLAPPTKALDALERLGRLLGESALLESIQGGSPAEKKNRFERLASIAAATGELGKELGRMFRAENTATERPEPQQVQGDDCNRGHPEYLPNATPDTPAPETAKLVTATSDGNASSYDRYDASPSAEERERALAEAEPILSPLIETESSANTDSSEEAESSLVSPPPTESAEPMHEVRRDPIPHSVEAVVEPTEAGVGDPGMVAGGSPVPREEFEPSGSDERLGRAARQAWQALASGKAAIAYQLGDAVRRLGGASRWGGPNRELSGLLLLSRYAGVSAEIDARIEQDLVALSESDPVEREEERTAFELLAGLGSLRPALFGSAITAMRLLDSLSLDGLGPLRSIRERIREFQKTGVVLRPPLLREIQEHVSWASECERHRRETALWLDRARKVTVLYARATDVWRDWVSNHGPLSELLQAVIEGTLDNEGRLRARLRGWVDPASVSKLIQRTDEELLGAKRSRAQREPIDARAKTNLLNHVADAVDRVQLWLDLLDARPTAGQVHMHEKARELRNGLLSELVGAREMVWGFTQDRSLWPLACAAAAGARCLEDLEGIFRPGAPDPVPPATADSLLYRPLLLVGLDDQGPACGRDAQDALSILDELSVLVEHEPGLREAFRAHCANGRPDIARRALTLLQEEEPEALDLPVLELNCQEAERAHHLRIRELIAVTEENIGKAAEHDLLTETERLDYIARLADIGRDPMAALEHGWLNFFREVSARIKERRGERLAVARARLAALLAAQPGADVSLVESCLSCGDFVTADEYLGQLEAGNPIQPVLFEDDPFGKFFPKFVREWTAVRGVGRELSDNRAVIDAVKARSAIRPFDFEAVGGKQLDTAARLVTDWFRAKGRVVRPYTLVLKEVLSGLGFDVEKIESDGSLQDKTWAGRMSCTPVESADLCPVPQFGSQAKGEYRLLCVYERPSAEELANLVEALGSGPPVIVLYFGRLTDQQRRDVAFICRTRHRSFIVVDECLVAFLCNVRGARLPVLFACALPFTTSDPYVTSSGSLPPEIFVGRERELQAIWDPAGTNLVFGGRQLGKTALLREVERRHHSPERGRIVRWIDLKAELVGGTVPPSDVWRILSANLARFGIVSEGTRSPERFVASVEKWLRAGSRRIVLLLDEADLFLDADQHDRPQYPVLLQLKNLMEKTRRAFKVVFAGLHNVQRTARDVNTPLAHLGEPLCIGPLIEGGEIREAMALIRRPLRALGFQFADSGPDPVVRILAFTNYYPGLIQLYCKNLLAYLTDPNRCSFDPRGTPPYTVTHEHLDRAHDGRLRDQIYDRFRLTLDLDPRYRVIALCIALRALEDRGEALFRDGVDVAWVRGQVLEWWPKGFATSSNPEDIRAILAEMIGLGLLRRTSSHGYTLRSPNVINVLGKKGDIEEYLLSSQDREPPPPYDAAAFHRASPGNPAVRSPLTAQQEADVLHGPQGVAVVFGVPAAGLENVDDFVRLAVGPEAVRTIGGSSERELFEALSDCLSSRREGLNVILVPRSAGWQPTWALRATERLRRQPSRKAASFKVLFVGGADQAWSWVSLDNETRRRLQTLGVTEMTLRPWNESAVQMWLQDLAVTPSDQGAKAEVERHTGFWPVPLNLLAEQFLQGAQTVSEMVRRSESRLKAALATPEFFGILGQPASKLRDLAVLGYPIAPEDCTEILGTGPEDLEWARSVEWAEILGLASRAAAGKLVLDRFARQQIIRVTGG